MKSNHIAAFLILFLTAGIAAPFCGGKNVSAAERSSVAYGAEAASLEYTAAGTSAAVSGSGNAEAGSSAAADETAMTDLVDGWPAMGAINEDTGYLIDADNDAILYSKNASKIRYPASTTKILTALLVIENCDLDETVTMTSTGTQMVEAGSTNAKTVNGETFTVEQCLYMLLLKSANDIANQLAEHAAGSMDVFVDMMNKRAAAIGCTNTHFTNPSGMPDSEHYTTAEDMALIMKECIKNDTFLKIAETETYTVPATKYSAERTYTNHNALVVKGSGNYYGPCIAGKTGYTDAAWRTYVGAAKKDGRTLIVVLMRGPDKRDFQDAVNLFEYGFEQFRTVKMTGGTADLPENVREEQLTSDSDEEEDGNLLVHFYYNGLRVGTAEMSQVQYEAYKEKISRMESVYEQEEAAASSRAENNSSGNVMSRADLRAVLIAIAVIFGVCLLGGLYSRRHSR